MLERVHDTSCLRSILGVKLSDRHSNAHVRSVCGIASLAAMITTNRLRWLGHVGRMDGGWQATAYSSVFILAWGVNEGKAWHTSAEVGEVCA